MKSLFQGMVEGIMQFMKPRDAIRILREAHATCETPEQKSLLMTAIQRMEEGVNQQQEDLDLCLKFIAATLRISEDQVLQVIREADRSRREAMGES